MRLTPDLQTSYNRFAQQLADLSKTLHMLPELKSTPRAYSDSVSSLAIIPATTADYLTDRSELELRGWRQASTFTCSDGTELIHLKHPATTTLLAFHVSPAIVAELRITDNI